jgi:hypothetical protein
MKEQKKKRQKVEKTWAGPKKQAVGFALPSLYGRARRMMAQQQVDRPTSWPCSLLNKHRFEWNNKRYSKKNTRRANFQFWHYYRYILSLFYHFLCH